LEQEHNISCVCLSCSNAAGGILYLFRHTPRFC